MKSLQRVRSDHMKQLLYLSLIVVALTATTFATAVPSSEFTGDYWLSTDIYKAGDIREYEPNESFYLALSEVGFTNYNFEPDTNPQLWQFLGTETQPTPEPGTLALLGSGIIGLITFRKRIAA